MKPDVWRSMPARASVFLVFLLGSAAASGGGLAMAPLVALAAIVVTPWRDFVRLAKPPWRFSTWAAAALVAWLGASIALSPTPDAGDRFLKAAATVVCGVLLAYGLSRASSDKTAREIALAGVALLCVLLIIDVSLGFPISRIGRADDAQWIIARSASKGIAILALFVWGAAVAHSAQQWRATLVAGGAAALTGALGLAVEMTAATLAVALGFAAWSAARIWPRGTMRAIGATLSGAIIAAPCLGLATRLPRSNLDLPYSWDQRLEIWRSATVRISEAPLFGYGFDASRAFSRSEIVNGEQITAIPLHPHNLGLQLWLEGGAVAAVLAGALVFSVTWRAARQCTARTLCAYAGLLVTWTVFSMLSFGAWQEWWIASFGAAIALVGLVAARDPQARALDA